MSDIDLAVQSIVHHLTTSSTKDYIGESVSQLEHALQCAYFAEVSGHSEEVILASLLHDIGHFIEEKKQANMADLGIVHHEWIGAKLACEMGFSYKVAMFIGYHVDAKRYLASKKENYFERLSDASKKTLTFQGGPMSSQEMRQFEKHAYFKEILQVRVNDERGKVQGLKVPDIYYYYARIKDHLLKNIEMNKSESLPLIDYVDINWVLSFKSFINQKMI